MKLCDIRYLEKFREVLYDRPERHDPVYNEYIQVGCEGDCTVLSTDIYGLPAIYISAAKLQVLEVAVSPQHQKARWH